MPKHKPERETGTPDTVEHAAPTPERVFTAWHYYLARVLEKTEAPGFQVHSFVKLGSLPLEADIILLHLDKNADIQAFAKYFSFLVPSLRPYLLLEFKSPADRLTLADFDTVRAYAMLCKRKYKVAHDEDVAVAMLYSRAEADFFDGCARSGFAFAEPQAGVRGCNHLSMSFSAVDLVAFGKEHPNHPINLLSARRREFWKNEHRDGLGPFDVLYERGFMRELETMSQRQLQGYEELLDDAARTRAVVLANSSVEERLHGIAPEEMLRRLSPEERLRGLPAEERLRGLPAEERLRGLPAEERLRGLSPVERARLRELLLK